MFPFHITFIDMQPKIMILRCCWTSLLFSRLINVHFSICFLAFKIKHCFTPLTINVPVSFHLASFRASVLILFWRIAIFIVTILRFDPSSEIFSRSCTKCVTKKKQHKTPEAIPLALLNRKPVLFSFLCSRWYP